jgi:cytochrome c-type biogenesis protein CcmH/NrfG
LHFLRAVGFAAAGAVLAWLVVSKTLVAFLAPHAPQAALWLGPGDPEALLSLAEARFDPAVRGTHGQVRGWVETALAGDPINARALRMLGQAAHAAGNESRAASVMQAAAAARFRTAGRCIGFCDVPTTGRITPGRSGMRTSC